jgi:hypothetical protein
MQPSDYLDAMRQALDLHSDYQLAKFLQVTKSGISSHRHNRYSFDEITALKVANALQIPPVIVMADMQAMRSKTADVRSFWEQLRDENGYKLHIQKLAISPMKSAA